MTTFVGRASELRLLHEEYAEAAAGHPRTVVIDSGAGLGKTALLDAFLAGLPPEAVFWSSGDEGERFLRFGVMGQLLKSRNPSWADPFAAGADLLRLLDDRDEAAVAVFVVDDAHLADHESLAALAFAVRRLGPDRVLAVLTARGEEVGRLPDGLLRRAESLGCRIRLEGLTDDEVISLAASLGHADLSRRSANRLRRHTAGSPLYLRALMEELPREILEASGPLPVPQSYAMLVLSLVASLPEPAGRLAQAASVLEPGALLSEVAAVAQVPDAEAVVEELTRARVVTCAHGEEGWQVRFTHPLTRAALYDDLGPHEHRELHLRAAGALTGDRALLHQFAACSASDTRLAAALATRADELRGSGDLRAAADWFLKAGRLAADEGTSWLMESAALFLTAGDVAAAKSAEQGIPDSFVSASRFYLRARIAWFGGEPGPAAELALQAWERADELDRSGRAELAAILAQLSNMQGDGLEAARWAEKALSEELPPDLADMTRAARAVGLMIAGRPQEALGALGDLAVVPEAVGLHQHHQLAARGALRGALGELDEARRDLGALVRSSPSELAPQRLLGLGVLAEVDYRLGRWDSALALAEQALSLAVDSEQVWVQGYLHSIVALVSAGRGWWDRAEGHLAAGHRLAVDLEDAATWVVCQNVSVHLASCRAEPDQVIERAQLLAALRISPLEEPGWLGWPVDYASALVQLGRFDEVQKALDHFGVVAAERGSQARLAALARVRGELATSLRQHAAAREAFEEGLALSVKASALEWGLIRASYGRFLRRRGERRSARTQLDAAYQRFRDLGATPFLQMCGEELAACGSPMEASTASSVDGLTPQEQIVARLVAEGLSNAEIAGQLVLSVKTVGYHLGNAYTKLGVHSRTQLAARLAAPGCATQKLKGDENLPSPSGPGARSVLL